MRPMWKTMTGGLQKPKHHQIWTKKCWKHGTSWPHHKGSKSEHEQGTETLKGISWCKQWHKYICFSQAATQLIEFLLAPPNNLICPLAPLSQHGVFGSIMKSSCDKEFQSSNRCWVMKSIPLELLFFPTLSSVTGACLGQLLRDFAHRIGPTHRRSYDGWGSCCMTSGRACLPAPHNRLQKEAKTLWTSLYNAGFRSTFKEFPLCSNAANQSYKTCSPAGVSAKPGRHLHACLCTRVPEWRWMVTVILVPPRDLLN